MTWAATQHYADFELQVRSVVSLKVGRHHRIFEAMTETLEDRFLRDVIGDSG